MKWYVYIMGYYSAMGKKEIPPFVTIWTGLVGIMLSGMSEKDKYCMLSLICGI